MSIFEAVMLLCFGAAWTFSIFRSWKSGKTTGKSILFLFIVLAGYISGIVNKLINSYDIVLFLYVLNSLLVTTDIILWFRNRAFENKERKGKA